jgi:hypothetical protein
LSLAKGHCNIFTGNVYCENVKPYTIESKVTVPYCNILDTIICCDDCLLLLKIMYMCWIKMSSTTLAPGKGASHMGQFNTCMGLDWTGICVRASNNSQISFSCLVNIFTNSLS